MISDDRNIARVMAKVELQWSSRRCKLRALSQQRHLPVIVRTVNSYNGLNGIDQLCTGQVRQLRVLAYKSSVISVIVVTLNDL